ncbi:hypothetical protein JOF42_000846 [Microbacterium phyllosphaerae]|uniref:Uncharacterized protein n=1 Tax=Microbacterium phyllosphaerae TaxID=124798 RepID=A0ABS4WMU4_9MICO|nr:hypothetical protein [Microbacterium phyllosphaerae]
MSIRIVDGLDVRELFDADGIPDCIDCRTPAP